MSKIGNATHEIYQMDTLAARDQWTNRIHPLVKLALTVIYIAAVVSFSKYDIIGLASMAVYLIAGFLLAELSFRNCLRRLRIVLPLVCVVGLANPFLDRTPVYMGAIQINAGVISMITLMMKGIFAVLASYLLIATTSIEKICHALRLLHFLKILVTQILLTYRYITVLLHEVGRMTQAYALRAPGQKGIHIKAWGSLVGLLLLRSIDRATELYESMTLRGYSGDYLYLAEKNRLRWQDICYLAVWLAVIILFRRFPIILLIGNWFT
ncbi:MAG: cobalt ECF transporter T component CbiQ [Lachnospiraceae bacterium]|nr:cobalt ECF transporter T component CbiQ [Lachnospiraceae bacterium]